MLEIDEIMPFYLCNREETNDCCRLPAGCFEDCKHTTNPYYAKHKEVIDIFEKFCDTFHVTVDDYGRLICIEKEEEK